MQRPAPLALPSHSAWERGLATVDAAQRALADPDRRRGVLWRMLWASFTLWSDAPEPAWPRTGAPLPAPTRLPAE